MDDIQIKISDAEVKTLSEVEKLLRLHVNGDVKIEMIQSALFEHRTTRGKILGSFDKIKEVS